MAGPDFLKENLNVAAQYAAWVTGGDVSSVDDIAPNSGAASSIARAMARA
jgi:hypothetical protein